MAKDKDGVTARADAVVTKIAELETALTDLLSYLGPDRHAIGFLHYGASAAENLKETLQKEKGSIEVMAEQSQNLE